MRAVEEGDRVAQLILEKIHTAEVLEVQVRTFQFTAWLENNLDIAGPGRDNSWCRRVWVDWGPWFTGTNFCSSMT